MTDEVRTMAVQPDEYIKTLEEGLAAEVIPQARLARELHLRIARVFYPWLSEQVKICHEHGAEDPHGFRVSVLNAACRTSVSVFADTVRNLMVIDEGSVGFALDRFTHMFAEYLGLHVEGDEPDEPEPPAEAKELH